MEKICGIYTITNKLDGKIYLGYSENIHRRLGDHYSRLNLKKHTNNKLQNAWNKYGKCNFLFEVLLDCEKEYGFSMENYWSNLLNVHDHRFGYNIAPTSPYGKSINDAAIALNINSNGISQNLTNRCNSYKGFIWKYNKIN